MKFHDWEAFKLKGDAVANAERMPKPEVIAAYFPMLAVIIPRWLNIVAGKNFRRGIREADQNKKVLFLISGAGTPWNTDHDASGNSTKGVAKLATWFLNQFYPEIEVHTIHSGVEIFHYDANVSFVNKELKPRIEEVRRILAEKYFDKWPKYMHLAITLTDGASARISAVNASLRHFKPDCLHMWQLKSFWHEYPFVTGSKGESDVEFHEHEKLEMTPPTLVSETDQWTKMLVKEMIAHKEEFERVRDSKERYNELDSFWLRKSKQPVLSVLMVKKKNKGVKFFRGINVEVSMPTGSLCSERNAIGSALSSDPALCRKDLRMIAVLALGLEPHSTTSTLSAQLPVAKEIIPIGHTPCSSASPAKSGVSPRAFPLRADEHLTIEQFDDQHVDVPGVAGTRTRQAGERSMLTRKSSNITSPTSKQAVTPLLPPTSPKISSEVPEDTTTPRKRKGGSSMVSPVLTGAALSATSSPALLSPRLRSATAAAAAATSGHSPRDLSAQLTGSTIGIAHEQSPSMTPTTRSAASTKDDNPRDRKRVRRANSTEGTTPPSVTELHGLAAQEAYLKHELDLINHRDAAMLAPGQFAQLSGNTAPNAIPPIDRTTSETQHPYHQAHHAHVTDERNPINPCGSCNEW